MKKWINMNDAAVLGKIFKRTIIIFLLGYLMYWFPFVHWNESGGLSGNPIGHTRIMGVLQRIALGYCAAALMIPLLEIKYSVNAIGKFSFDLLAYSENV